MIRIVFNEKGGVGKTSLACNLAAAQASSGRKTLVIDVDPQANATRYLMGPGVQEHTIADFFASTLSLQLFQERLGPLVTTTPFSNLFLIPGDQGLTEIQNRLEAKHKILKLSQALASLQAERHYDEIWLDAPPNLNFFSLSALIAARRVLIPFDCDAFSQDAVARVVRIVSEIKSDYEKPLEVEGVIINQFQKQARLPAKIIDELRAAGYPILEPFLSSSVVMRESHSVSKPLVWYRPQHPLTLEIKQLAAALGGFAAVKESECSLD